MDESIFGSVGDAYLEWETLLGPTWCPADHLEWLAAPPFGERRAISIVRRAREVLAQEFLAHWSRVLRDLEAKIDVAERERINFLSVGRDRMRLARAHYKIARARRFSSMGLERASRQIRPWADLAITVVLRDEWKDLRTAYDSLRAVAEGEYVVFGNADWCRTNRPYAGSDDYYERAIGGVSNGRMLTFFKQTGERFTPKQARAAFFHVANDLVASIWDNDGRWLLSLEHDGPYVQVNITDTSVFDEYRKPDDWCDKDAITGTHPELYVDEDAPALLREAVAFD